MEFSVNVLHDPEYDSSHISINGRTIIDIEHHVPAYVADWESGIDQKGFLDYLRNLGYEGQISALIQSKETYPEKTLMPLSGAFDMPDDLLYLALNVDDHGITWYRDGQGPPVIEFQSDKRNLGLLMDFFYNTFGEFVKLVPPDLVGKELESALSRYPE